MLLKILPLLFALISVCTLSKIAWITIENKLLVRIEKIKETSVSFKRMKIKKLIDQKWDKMETVSYIKKEQEKRLRQLILVDLIYDLFW